jgi:hypothetical protein
MIATDACTYLTDPSFANLLDVHERRLKPIVEQLARLGLPERSAAGAEVQRLLERFGARRAPK